MQIWQKRQVESCQFFIHLNAVRAPQILDSPRGFPISAQYRSANGYEVYPQRFVPQAQKATSDHYY